MQIKIKSGCVIPGIAPLRKGETLNIEDNTLAHALVNSGIAVLVPKKRKRETATKF